MSKTTSRATNDPVKSYLIEIGRIPLLTPEQELVYGQQVQQMMTLLTVEAELTQTLGGKPTKELWAEAVQLDIDELEQQLRRGEQAKQKMIEANLRLVVAIAKKYQKRNLEFLDLIQEGTIGLKRGVEKFDPLKGYRFSTYAYWWIKQGITRAISQQGRTIRLPIHVNEKLNKIKRTERELSQKLGRTPTNEEIGTALNFQPQQIEHLKGLARRPVSFDLKVGDQQDTELLELLEDPSPSPDFYTTQKSLRYDIQQLLFKLSPQHQKVLNLRYGLVDGDSLSLAKIAQHLNLSRERVRQIEREAIKYLQQYKHQIKDYLAS